MNHQQRDGSYYIGNSMPILAEMGKNLDMYPESYRRLL